MKNIVYISCSTADKALAIEISDLLNKYHISTFISCMANNIEENYRMIDEMRILLLLFSKETLNSAIIDNEVTEAINRQIPIVPYRVDDTSIKESLSLDFMLKKSQWVLGYPDKQKQMDDLFVSICRYLGVDAIQQNPTDPFEQFKRGIALEYGTNGLEKDREQAMLWLKKSASQGNYMAMYELYNFYRNSEDQNKYTDYNQAKEWLIKAADEGLAEAQYVLGTNYEVFDEHLLALYSIPSEVSQPLNISKDIDMAKKYYGLATKQGHKKAMFRLGMLTLLGKPSDEEKKTVFNLLSTISEDLNYCCLWLELGHLYKEGLGGTENISKCLDCYKRAKGFGEYDLCQFMYEQGDNYQLVYEKAFMSKHDRDPRFQMLRASFYEDGNIVNKNMLKASEYLFKASELFKDKLCNFHNPEKGGILLKRSATLGNAEALYKIALSLYSQEDYYQAFKYFSEAAQRHLPVAKMYLGIMCLDGHGTEKDDKKAFNWLKQADIPGLAYATTLLGDLYLQGEGTDQDVNMAIDCYRRAANQNEYVADLRLSEAYKNGWGVTVNIDASEYWYSEAIKNGYKP